MKTLTCETCGYEKIFADDGSQVHWCSCENRPGVWLSVKTFKPKGSMILWRYPGGRKWRLSLAYKTVCGHYKDCGGLAGGNLEDMTHFMEIPE